MSSILLLLLLLGLVSAVLGAANDDGVQINIANGPILGETFSTKRGRGGRVWLGIPYAEPPIGDLRFEPPQPLTETWDKQRATKWFGNICMQGSNIINMSENCLFLNVWAPPATASATDLTGHQRNNNDSLLPVMVFLYGGSWTDGSASIPLYTGRDIIGTGHDVVIVTLNYRLKAFGFLGSDSMQSQSSDGSTGNMGLQDQRMALKWVQQNIAQFGGNPANVMLFGESAGAGSTSNHLIMPQSFGLFQQAAMESGPFAAWSAQTMAQQNFKYQEVLAKVNCSADAAAPQQLKCLRALSADVLNSAHGSDPDLFTKWAPTIDGVEILDNPQTLAQKGKFAPGVKVLLGTNLDEGTMFANNVSTSLNASEFHSYMTQLFGPVLGPQVVEQYPVSDFKERGGASAAWWANIRVASDDSMTCPARRTARWLTKAGVETYLYFFTHEVALIKVVEPTFGVFHGSELLFVFNNPDGVIPLTSDEKTLAEQFGYYWTSFAAHGNPNPPNGTDTGDVDLIQWPRYDTSSDKNIVLDTTLSVESNLLESNCDFWDTIYNTPPSV